MFNRGGMGVENKENCTRAVACGRGQESVRLWESRGGPEVERLFIYVLRHFYYYDKVERVVRADESVLSLYVKFTLI